MSRHQGSEPEREPAADKSVSSIPLETEDGGEVVITQQNAGPGNQVGGGEFKDPSLDRSRDEAAAEQEELEADQPAPGGAA